MNQLQELDQAQERSSVMQLWEKLWWSKWLIICSTGLFLLLGLTYVFLSAPIYSADTIIQIEQQEDSTTGAELGDDLTLTGSASPLTAELQILKSRSVLGSVLDKFQLDLEAKPVYFPIVGEAIARRRKADLSPEEDIGLPTSRWYDLLSSFSILNLDNKAWGDEFIQVERFEIPEKFNDHAFTLTALPESAFELRDEQNDLVLSGMVGTLASADTSNNRNISILVTDLNARIGTQFTVKRSVRSEVLGGLRDNLRISELGDESGIVKLELKGSDPKKIEDVLNAITSAYLQVSSIQKVSDVQNNLDFLEQRLPIVESDLASFEEELNLFRLDRGSIDFDLETQNTLSRIVTIEAEIRDIDLRRNELRTRFTARHPSVAGLDTQKVSLTRELEALQDRVNEMPQIQQQYLSLTRNVEINSSLYTELLSRAEELKIAMASATDNINILDEASATSKPVAPQKPALLAIAALMGGVLGALYSLLRSSMAEGVDDPNEIEKQLGIPVLATIPQSSAQAEIAKPDKKTKPGVLALAHLRPSDVSIESLRNLRTTMLYQNDDARNNIVLITSASPQVGKSFVSLNLSVLLANSGENVVLVDADMRRGHLHDSFSTKQSPGLSNSVTEGLLMYDIVQPTEIDGLSFLPRGNSPSNPSDLLLSNEFLALLINLSLRFDHVIIDSPPVLAAADAGIIGNSADSTFLVVKSGISPLREIAQGQKQLKQNSVELSGVLVNDIVMANRSRSYSGYIYQYSTKES